MRQGLSCYFGDHPTGIRLRTCGLSVLFLLILLGTAQTAQAVTITFRYDGFNPSPASVFGRSVIDPASNVRVDSNSMPGGRFLLTVLSLGGSYSVPGGGDTLQGFCIEPRQTVNVGQTYTNTIAPLSTGTNNIGGMGQLKADLIVELFGRYLQDFNAPLTRQEAGALQVAVWEIVREDSGILDVYSGDIYFWATNEDPIGTVALAQSFVQSLDGTGPKLTNLYALNNGTAQDIIVQLQTPEPPAMGILGLGLIGLGALRRRK